VVSWFTTYRAKLIVEQDGYFAAFLGHCSKRLRMAPNAEFSDFLKCLVNFADYPRSVD